MWILTNELFLHHHTLYFKVIYLDQFLFWHNKEHIDKYLEITLKFFLLEWHDMHNIYVKISYEIITWYICCNSFTSVHVIHMHMHAFHSLYKQLWWSGAHFTDSD